MNADPGLSSQITPKNMNVRLDNLPLKGESKEINEPLFGSFDERQNKENQKTADPNSENSKGGGSRNQSKVESEYVNSVVLKINKMVETWSRKYKFHTQVDTAADVDAHNLVLVTEFSAPQMDKPIPDATAKVTILHI